MIISNDHPRFFELLNQIGISVGYQSALHTQSGLTWYRQRPIDEGKSVQDRSFILILNDIPVIGFQGATTTFDGKTDLLAYEIPCISIEDKGKLTTKATKTFLKEFDEIMQDLNGTILYRDSILDGELSCLSKYLLRKGGKLKPNFSQVIDYSTGKAVEKSSIRKSYKSLINWGNRELQPKVYDESNITWDHMNVFRQLHIDEAGRETRSVASWRLQYEMVKAGEAFVVFGHLNNEVVSAGLFMHSNTNCFYGISASRRDLFKKPMFHSLMWLAILHAKKIGCSWFEVGEQLFPNHPSSEPPSKKELGISEFKAGFGGKTICKLLLTLDRSINN